MEFSIASRLPDQYNFIMNPYPDMRVSRCPMCDAKTGQRKLPLFIHIEPQQPVALNYTNRYCRHCDLLIANKHEIEHYLTRMFKRQNPAVIGNEYMVMGTFEKKYWREGMKEQKTVAGMLEHVHFFREYYKEMHSTRPGYYHEDQEPPIMEPPPSKEWVKNRW